MRTNKRILGAGLGIVIIFAVIFSAATYVYLGTLRSSLLNGDFSLKKVGWRGSGGELREDSSGNKYVVNDYNWGLYQIVTVQPGSSLILSADTMKGTSETAARLVVLFKTNRGEQLPGYSINYWHQSSNWETIPGQVINVPDGATKMLIYLLTLKDTGYHCFDNIYLARATASAKDIPPVVNINQPLKLPAAAEEEALPEILDQIGGGDDDFIYIVVPGDTLSTIAENHGIGLDAIIQLNNIDNQSSIYPGQKLLIPLE